MRPFVRRFFPLILTALILAPEARAQRFTIEAESYTAYSESGGAAIQSLPLSGCSGGYFLYGLDTAGEWVQYDLTAGRAGVFSCTIKCRGVLNRDYAFRAVFTPVAGGDSRTVDFNFTGEGFG
jgi:hypothetical protein